jgi:RNA polymerase sigma-70 factor (sigma-E family)
MERTATAVEGAIASGGSSTKLERIGEWFTAEYDGLLRFALLISGDTATAEDLVHEAFVRLYRSERQIEAHGFAAYARRTILNVQRSAFRRFRSERRAIAAHGAEAHAEHPVPAPHVWRAVLALPRQQRACVVLRYYEGMTDQEIANTLGVGHGTVKKAMNRALTSLRAEIGEE